MEVPYFNINFKPVMLNIKVKIFDKLTYDTDFLIHNCYT